jgi:putative transposase
VHRPRNWKALVNAPLTDNEQEAVKTCMKRNRPYGSETWQKRTANRLGLTASMRREGRPKKAKQKDG